MKTNLQSIPRMVRKGSVILVSYFLFAACMQYDESLAPRDSQNDVLSKITVAEAGGVAAEMKRTFTAHLTGEDEVPANASAGQGEAIFRLSDDGTEMHYELIVANIENVRAAHIHCAPEGVNGPVVVPLFGSPAPVNQNGVLAEGTITDANVVALACVGGVKSLANVLELIRSGNAYVNVHTTLLPGGEIRGQVK